MSYCINPHCPLPDHPGNTQRARCSSCESPLVIQGKYRVDRLISDKSGFGLIYAAHSPKQQKILKVLREEHTKNTKAVELFVQEADVLSKLRHPGIPKIDGFFTHEVSGGLVLQCLCMEKISGVNLEQWQQSEKYNPLAQETGILWLKALTEVLAVVHQRRYLHRDIKPANIMLAPDGRLVLIDFGTARDVTATYLANIGQGVSMTAVVSSGYTAPEQMNGKAVEQSDFFSLGRTFVQLLTGRHPLDMYNADNDVLEWRKFAPQLTPAFADLLDQMMTRKPNERPLNAGALLRQLNTIEKVINRPQEASTTTVSSSPTKITKLPFRWPWKITGFILSLGLIAIGGYFFGPIGMGVAAVVGIIMVGWSTRITPVRIDLKHNFFAHAKTTTALAFSADSQFFITAGGDRTIRTWQTKSFQLIHTLVGHSDWVYSVAAAPGGQMVISGSGDKTLKVWQAQSGVLLETLLGHDLGVNVVAVMPDESCVVSASADRTIKIWDLRTYKLLKTINAHTQSIDSLILGPDRTIISASADKTIKIWDTAKETPLRTFSGHQDTIRSLVLSGSGKVLFSGSADQTIKFWDMDNGKLIRTLTGHRGPIHALAIDPKRELLFSGGDDKRINIWHFPSGILFHSLRGHSASITGLAISQDGKNLISSSGDGSVKVWRL